MRRTEGLPAAIFVLLFVSSCARSSHEIQRRPIACHQFPNGEPAACEQTIDGRIVLSQRSLADIPFGPEGLGSLIVDSQGLYFVNHQGKTVPAFRFDNGTDNVVEGMARTLKDGKVGFVNAQLDQVVAPVWDFAFPFADGVAVVCMGCVSTALSKSDEHTTVKGGKWGYIDKRGNVVVPVIYDSRSLPPPEVAAKLAIP